MKYTNRYLIMMSCVFHTTLKLKQYNLFADHYDSIFVINISVEFSLFGNVVMTFSLLFII